MLEDMNSANKQILFNDTTWENSRDLRLSILYDALEDGVPFYLACKQSSAMVREIKGMVAQEVV